MIDKSESRIGIFGASETALIMSNHRNKTYQTFLKQKAGLIEREELDNKYITAGNVLEHLIIDYIAFKYDLSIEKDKQCFDIENNLRVNLDGNTSECVYEIKTRTNGKRFSDKKPPKNYWQQVQVQMYASGVRQGKLVVLYLYEEDYELENMLGFEIKDENVVIYDIECDPDFIKEYLKELKLANKRLKNLMKLKED